MGDVYSITWEMLRLDLPAVGRSTPWPVDPAPRDAIWCQVCQEVRQQFMQGPENGFETWTRPLLAWQRPEPLNSRLNPWQGPFCQLLCWPGSGTARNTKCWFPNTALGKEPFGCFSLSRERVLQAGWAGSWLGWSARVLWPSPLEHHSTHGEPGLPNLPAAGCGEMSSPAFHIEGWPDERKRLEITGLGFCKAPNSV